MISKQQIEAAKWANPPNFLQSLGIAIVASGASFHLKDHDSLKFFHQNGVWLYKWWSRNGEVGDGIQYLMPHCLMSFKEAVTVLSGSPFTEYKVDPVDQLRHRISKPQHCKTPKWQSEGKKLIQFSRSCLLGPNGKDPGKAWKHMCLRKWVKTGLQQSGKIRRCKSHERGCPLDQ